MKSTADRRDNLQSLEKAVSVVDLLARAGNQGISEIAATLGLSKPAVHRIMTTLGRRGLVAQDARTRRYHLEPAIWEIAVQAMHRSPLLELAARRLQYLARAIGQNVNLSVPDGVETLFLARVAIEDGEAIFYPVAIRHPTYCNAAGKAMLAFQDEDAVETVIRAGLAPLTPATITDGDALRRELARAKIEGLAFNRGEVVAELFGLAVPIFDRGAQAVAALGMSAPRERFTPEFIADVGACMREEAHAVSRMLGYQDASPATTTIA